MTSASNDSTELDHPGQATEAGSQEKETRAARGQQPVSLALLTAGLILLFTTRILGSLSGGPFNSVADVGPRPLWALSAVLLLASLAVASYRK